MMLTVVDVNGGSVFLNPESKYAPLSWLEISGGAQIPVGKSGGEFTAFEGRTGNPNLAPDLRLQRHLPGAQARFGGAQLKTQNERRRHARRGQIEDLHV